MKKLIMALTIISIFSLESRAQQYVDLISGKRVVLVKNYGNGYMYNVETQRPLYLYINPTTRDTFYGRTGEVVNGKITRTRDGRYLYSNDAYVYKDGDYVLRTSADNDKSPYYKRKVKDDGTVKEKDLEYKKKVEADGDVKVKDNGAKTKIENDGVQKVKDGDYRKKIDAQGNEKEKDNTGKVKQDADGSLKVKDKEADYKGKVEDDGTVKEKSDDGKLKVKKDKAKAKDDDSKVKVKDDGSHS